MATVIDFISDSLKRMPTSVAQPHTYNVEVSAYPNDYIEFTANGVKTDSKSLSRIADELEKIARIIRSDVIMKDAPAS